MVSLPAISMAIPKSRVLGLAQGLATDSAARHLAQQVVAGVRPQLQPEPGQLGRHLGGGGVVGRHGLGRRRRAHQLGGPLLELLPVGCGDTE